MAVSLESRLESLRSPMQSLARDPCRTSRPASKLFRTSAPLPDLNTAQSKNDRANITYKQNHCSQSINNTAHRFPQRTFVSPVCSDPFILRLRKSVRTRSTNTNAVIFTCIRKLRRMHGIHPFYGINVPTSGRRAFLKYFRNSARNTESKIKIDSFQMWYGDF